MKYNTAMNLNANIQAELARRERRTMKAECIAAYSAGKLMSELAAEHFQTARQIRRWVKEEHERMAAATDPFLRPSAEQRAEWAAGWRKRGPAKLTDTDRLIVLDRAAGMCQHSLAAKYGTSRQHVRTVLAKMKH